MAGEKQLVFVPTPGMGHLRSTVELAKLIIQRDDTVSILILIINLPFDTTIFKTYLESNTTITTSRLTFLPLPTPPNPPEPTSPTFYSTYINLHKSIVKRALLDRLGSGSPKPVGFVLDMFCTTMMDVADELEVPSYIFFTSGAAFLRFALHMQTLVHHHGVDITTEFANPGLELDVPGFRNRVPAKVIPGLFYDEEMCNMLLNHFTRLRGSKGILVNTFMELESYALQSLMEQDKGKIPPVYPVGPILELGNKTQGEGRKEEEGSIMKWLDEQPDSSVVFLCFGSMGSFNAVQVKEIAKGLDRSGHRFLWSLRRPPPEGKLEMPSQHETFDAALPEGFLDRTSHRGKIIGWAPQASILAHKAVGGFVSHCGWNSTLESLWFGVPMATWPLYAEQSLNAFELVKELGLGVEISMDYNPDRKTKKSGFEVSGEVIENAVKKLMNMDEETRVKVKALSENGKKALQDVGSSHHWLGRFIEDLDNVDFK